MKRVNGEGSIYYDRRRGRYVACVSVGRDSRTGRLIRRQRIAHSQAEALQYLAELRECYGQESGRPQLRVADYIQTYTETFKKPLVRANTWLNYVSLLKHVHAVFGELNFADLSPARLQIMVSNIASANVRHRLVVLARSACRQAMREGLLAENPFTGIQAPVPKRQKEIHILSKAEARRLLQAAEAKPPLYMAILMQYMTGLRAEEVLGLTWDSIDMENCCLQVKQVTNQAHGVVILDKPKTDASRRSIFFSGKLKAALVKYHEWQQATKSLRLDLWNKPADAAADFVYTYDGSPQGIHQYASAFRRVAEQANIPATSHGLRHTHATQLFSAGWSAKDVQMRLGHTSVALTLDTYTHYFAERGKELAASLDGLYPCAE